VALLKRVVAHALTAALAGLVLRTPVAAEQRTATAEDDIKATFLFNFTKYIDWPNAGRLDEFRVCLVAEPAFASALDRIIIGETAQGHPLSRLSPASPDAARGCQMLFLGRLEDERLERWITAVRGAPVLVVGETRAAWDHGVHVNFVVEDNRVRFDVNADAASAAGLTVSSKLLRVARQVKGRSR
jgi:hypothetical protein